MESLTSPFWTAFALTLTQTFGATVLALPIAVAGLGPVPGLVAVVTIGLVNILTMAAFVEAFRSFSWPQPDARAIACRGRSYQPWDTMP